MAYENLCMNCMKDKGSSSQCPHCHFNNDTLQLAPFLPMRTIVGDHYLIGAVIDSNGDGTTYMALDTRTNTPVEIREFLPDAIVRRDENTNELVVRPGNYERYTSMLTSFEDLWRRLSRMSGLSALIQVEEVFEANQTAYAVCEHVEGVQSLRDYLLSTKEGYLSWKDARILFMAVLSTLSNLHQAGIIHRGISPANLYIYPGRKLKLSGFSIPECRTVNGGLATEVYPGYTPVEQLGVNTSCGAWTDIYSFAAVLYRALIGKTPIDAMARLHNDEMMIPAKFAETLPGYVVNAMVNALQVLPEDRTRDVERFRTELSSSVVTEMASEYEFEQKERRRSAAYAPAQGNPLDDTQVIPIGTNYREQPQYETPRYEPPHQQRAERLSSEEPESYNNVYDDEYDYEDEYDTKGSGKASRIITTSVIVILAITLLAFGINFLVNGRGGNRDKTLLDDSSVVEAVDVPDFVGKRYTSISANSSYTEDFRFTVKEVYSEDVNEGYVISQSVDPGTKVASGTEIELTVSKGIHREKIPDVEGMTYSEAKAKLEALGFKVERIDRTNIAGLHPAETVASQSPSGASGREYIVSNTTITLQVWTDRVITTEATTESSEETTTGSNVNPFAPLIPGLGDNGSSNE